MSIKNERYFRIKNWEKYQHRDHKKTMPWIKVYTCLLDDAKFLGLEENYQLFWFKLLILSGRNGNEFPNNSKTLRKLLHTNCYIKVEKYERLGLVEFYSTRSERADDAVSPSLDKIREDKRRQDKNPPTPLQELKSENGVPKKAAEKPSFKVEKIMQIWNEKGLPQLKGFFPKRTEVVTEFWGEKPDLEYWGEVFSRVRRSEFLMGEGKNKPWRTTLEWVMHRHIEIMEGKYDNEKSQYAVPLRHSPGDDSNRT